MSAVTWLDSGVYQRLDCGCVMFVIDVADCMRLALVEGDGTCGLEHVVGDFLPMRVSRDEALRMAS